jgi:hypothetical protein
MYKFGSIYFIVAPLLGLGKLKSSNITNMQQIVLIVKVAVIYT